MFHIPSHLLTFIIISAECPNVSNMDTTFPHWGIKLVGTVILLVLCMFFGIIPLKLRRSDGVQTPRRALFISLANCFAGGVFFSTVILDLFPMVKVKMHEALIYAEIETEFPMGDFLVGVGFLFMLLLEQIIHSCCNNTIVDHHGHAHAHGVKNRNSDPSESDDEDSDEYNSSDKDRLLGKRKKVSISARPVNEDEGELEKSIHSIDSNGEVYYPPKMRRDTYSIVSAQSPGVQSNFRTYVLVFAISLHSIFEGLAVGLILKPNQLYQIYIALLIHKSIIAFSIGVQLVDARLTKKVHTICITIFSVMTPLGVALGLLVLNSFDTGVKLFFSGILQAMATGTFLYVTFFEVLPHELSIDDDKKTLKILFVIIGYALVTGICTYENRFHKLKKIKPGNETVLIGLDI